MKTRYRVISLVVVLAAGAFFLGYIMPGKSRIAEQARPLIRERANQFIVALKEGNGDSLAQLTDPGRRPSFIADRRINYQIKLTTVILGDLQTAFVTLDVTSPAGSAPVDDDSPTIVSVFVQTNWCQVWKFIDDDWYYCGDAGADPDNLVLRYGNVEMGGPPPLELSGQ